jgi:hypothetical protein
MNTQLSRGHPQIFHEQSFWQKYDRIFGNGSLQKSEVNFLRLFLVLISLGARLSTIATESVGTAVELGRLIPIPIC